MGEHLVATTKIYGLWLENIMVMVIDIMIRKFVYITKSLFLSFDQTYFSNSYCNIKIV